MAVVLRVSCIPFPDPREDPKSRTPKFWILILLWRRLQSLQVDLLFGSAQGSGLLIYIRNTGSEIWMSILLPESLAKGGCVLSWAR